VNTSKDQYNLSEAFTDSQLADIILYRQQGEEWDKLVQKFNKKWNTAKTTDSIKHAYRRYKDYFEMDSTASQVKHLKEIRNSKQTSAKNARENRALLDFLNNKDDVLKELEEMVKRSAKIKPVKFKKQKKTSGKKKSTLELLLSDLHFGKQTKTFNLAIARQRMQDLCRTTLAEIERSSLTYNVERIILALMGDLIESSTMHGVESAMGCEFGNSKQITSAVESIFFDVILPIAKTGIKVDVPGIPGNHDRTQQNRTYNDPGQENTTYIVYRMLQLLSEAHGLTNVTFYTTDGPYIMLDIYGSKVLYEHGDNVNNYNRESLEKLMNKRQSQLKTVLDFFRLGHFHDYVCYGRGKIIVNGSLTGQDSFADVLGYDAMAQQILNQYVETTHRPTPFFRSFPIYLK
jgi:hypothetical protein